MDVRTRGGVFGSGGYGGGIFDGSMSISGLGMVGAVMQATAGLGAWTWMNRTPDPEIIAFQKATNKELTKRGFKPIGVDGQLGPGTCGAWVWLGSLTDLDWSASPDLQLLGNAVGPDATKNPCKGYTMPTKVGAGKPWVPPTTAPAVGLPWGVYSAATVQVQHDVNDELDAHGYLLINPNGILDAPTCGAMKLSSDAWGMDFMTTFGGNCQGFTAPTKKAASTPGPVTPPDGPVTPPPVVRHTSTTAWMVGGLLGAAVIGSLYAVNKKKRKAA
jgi:hypothetical protein